MTRLAWVATGNLNAWSLRAATHSLDVELKTQDPAPSLPFAHARPFQPPEVLLFTDEDSLLEALREPSPAHFYPKRFPLDLLDDKAAFADWLLETGERPIPHLLGIGGLEYPCLVKGRHSWRQRQNIPRGWACRSDDDLRAAREAIARLGLPEQWFFTQRWLGDRERRVLSVCGFFDSANPHRELMSTCSRTTGYGGHLSSSAAVETVADPAGLEERTRGVLRGLDYTGPFELEFLELDDDYVIIELNPRFWLQNAIFLKPDNGLMTRYLDLDGPDHWSTARNPRRSPWVDGFWLVRSLMRADRNPLRLVRDYRRRGYDVVVMPAPSEVLRMAPRLARGRLARQTGDRPSAGRH